MANEIPLYQRSVVPQAVSIAKPSFALADRSGQVTFGQAVQQTSAKLFQKLETAKTNNQYHEFLGKVGTAQEDFRGYLLNNPGATLPDMEKERDKLIKGISASTLKLTTPRARGLAKNWMAENKETLIERVNADIIAISTNHEMDKMNNLIANADSKQDIQEIFSIIDDFTGTLISEEESPFLKEKASANAARPIIGEMMIQMAIKENSWEAPLEWINDPKNLQQLADDFGIGLKTMDAVVEDVRTQYDLEKKAAFGRIQKEALAIEDDTVFNKWIREQMLSVNQMKMISANRTWWRKKEQLEDDELGYKVNRDVMGKISGGEITNLLQIDEVIGDNELASRDELYDMLARKGKPEAKTDWGKYNKVEDDIMKFLINGGSRGEIETKLRGMYRSKLSDADYTNLWNRLDTELPDSLLINLDQAMRDNNREAAREPSAGRFFWPAGAVIGRFLFSDKERERASKVNAALFKKEVRNFDAGKESSLAEIYKTGKELSIPFEDSVNFQTAPDISLDKYWDRLAPASKQQLWQIWDDGDEKEKAKALKDMDNISQGETPAPKTKVEYDAIESGTEYLDPDGKRRIKK